MSAPPRETVGEGDTIGAGSTNEGSTDEDSTNEDSTDEDSTDEDSTDEDSTDEDSTDEGSTDEGEGSVGKLLTEGFDQLLCLVSLSDPPIQDHWKWPMSRVFATLRTISCVESLQQNCETCCMPISPNWVTVSI
jgi:hypothetical protein